MIVVGDLIVEPQLCLHEGDTLSCMCIHDWRIHWGNVPRQSGGKLSEVPQ